MLTLSETHSTTQDIAGATPLSVDIAVSEGVLTVAPEIGIALYDLIVEAMPALWTALVPHVVDNDWIVQATQPDHGLAYSVLLVSNAEIQVLNRDFRGRDQPTDVLTFTLADDADAGMPLQALPEVNLGEIYISVDWALEATSAGEIRNISTFFLNLSHPLPLYCLERLVHGSLHLLGVHHDTMSDYNRVTQIQRLVLHALHPTVDSLAEASPGE